MELMSIEEYFFQRDMKAFIKASASLGIEAKKAMANTRSFFRKFGKKKINK
jgi:hypothetical protein